MSDAKSDPTLYLPLIFLSLLIFFLGWTAFHLQIQYNDSFAILNNARAISNGNSESFSFLRPAFLPLIYSIFFHIENLIRIDDFAFQAIKLSTSLTFIIFLVVTYHLFRLFLNKQESLLAIALLSTNRILIHIVPFIKEDLPAALLMTGTMLLYVRIQNTFNLKSLIGLSVVLTMTILTRHNLAIFLFLFIFFHQASVNQAWPFNKTFWFKVTFLFVIPTIIFFLVPGILLIWLKHIPFHQVPAQVLADFQRLFSLHSTSETGTENIMFLALSTTWPILCVSIVGFWSGINKRNESTLFFGLWMLLFFILHNFLFGHREARYLLPLLIPVYFFAIQGFKIILEKLQKYSSTLKTIVVFFILLWPVTSALKECLHFRDSIYQNHFESTVSLNAEKIAGQHQIYWIGQMYPLTPKEFIFHKEDEFFYFYHFFNNVVSFFTGKTCPVFLDLTQVKINESDSAIFVRGIGHSVKDGDVLIVNPEKESCTSKTLPQEMKPLTVERVRIATFKRTEETRQKTTFTSNKDSNAQITLSKDSYGPLIEGKNIKATAVELYLTLGDSEQSLNFPPFEMTNGHFSAYIPYEIKAIKEIRLLSYEGVQVFSAR